MRYVGMDYHKGYSQVTVMEENGEIVNQAKLTNEPEALKRYFEKIGSCEVVLEAGRNWYTMYDLLEELVEEIHVAHPLKVRAIAEARVKTDKIDSETLAHLLRSDLLPCIHIPQPEVRDNKKILRQRMFFVAVRTMVKNRIHDIMDRQRIKTEQFSDLFGKGGMEYLKGLELPEPDNSLLKEQIDTLEELNQHIETTNELIHKMAEEEPRLKWVDSIPGIGEFLGLLAIQEIDTVERFSGPEKLAAYAGLVPSTYASGGKVWHGRITKQGNKYLRWAMIEAVRPALKKSVYLRNYYVRIEKRGGRNHAKVATARKILGLIWTVLKEKREYQEHWKSRLPSIRLSHV